MSKQLVKQVREVILENFKAQLLARWLGEKRDEINKKVNEETTSREKELIARTKSNGCNLHLMSNFPYNTAQYRNSYVYIRNNSTKELYYIQPDGEYERAKVVNFNLFEEKINALKDKEQTRLHLSEEQINKVIISNGGHTHYSKHNFSSQLQVYTYEIREKLENEYKQQFNHAIWEALHGLEEKFGAAVDALQPEKAIEQFFDRHPWVPRNYLNKQSIPYQFLHSYLNERLLATLRSPALASFASATMKQIENKEFQWQQHPFVEEWLSHYIEGYPLSDVQSMYIANPRVEYLNHACLGLASANGEQKSANGEQKLNNPISRIDIFRYLYNYNALSMRANETAERIATTRHAPMHISELENLTPSQWNSFNNLFINIGHEYSPVWILLSKTAGGWKAYLPPAEMNIVTANQIASELTSIPALKGLTFASVNCEDNLKLNDVEKLNNLAQWHAILLGRVFPACAEIPNKPLASFRDKVPVPVLHQQVLEQCMYGIYVGYDNPVENVKRAARNRKPFSKLEWHELNPLVEKNTYYLLDDNDALRYVNASHVLSGFDQKQLSISEDLKTLTLDDASYNLSTYLTEALDMVYHYSMTRLVTPALNLSWLQEQLFDYDVNLRTVKPQRHLQNFRQSFGFALQCAARNRFLAEVGPDTLSRAAEEPANRKKLWSATGNALVDFFKQNGQTIDLDFIKEIQEFNASWRKSHCDHEERAAISSTAWAFVQFAQMGKRGLDELFNVFNAYSGDPDEIEPSPNLPCTFDLNGSLVDEPHEYLAYLAAQIKNYHPRDEGYSPLFKSLSLILPDNLDDKTSRALLELITVLDARKKRFPQELAEVNLYNLRNPDAKKQSNQLINGLTAQAKYQDLQIQINIPEWNREAYKEEETCALKSSYRGLQNIILNNQRGVNHAKLAANTANIYAAATDSLDAELILDNKLAQEPQLWKGEEVLYPLTAQTPGIQQQLQQEVVQEFQVEEQVEEEQEQEQEQEQQIVQFYGDERELITRDNIDERCKQNWETLAENTKALSGWKKQELKQLFSLWVGSDLNASQVVEKIHPNAVQKIMEHAPQFRMGVAKDNLPPGFYLQYSLQNRGLILNFDEKREKKDLRALKQKKLKERNPFTVELDSPKKPNEFRGDYRQFEPLSRGKEVHQTLWQYLTLEDNDKQRILNAQKVIGNQFEHSPETASVILQHFDVTGEFKRPEDYNSCLQYLDRWAQGLKTKISPQLRELLFNNHSSVVLTEKNLKAFGQVFNHCDVNNRSVNGSEHFLFIADQVLTTFGQNHFEVWKRRFLDVSENWSEFLEKSEVDALALSIATLKNFPRHQSLWWKLVDAHGCATGHMRYADLWYAFQKVLSYAENRDLIIDEESLTRLLKDSPDFNGKVFLDRLYRVLQDTKNQLDSKQVQQHILNHLHEIDWRHNGFYYAARYQHFPYWDQQLQLSNFSPATANAQPGYAVRWDEDFKLLSPLTHALRFASQRMQLSQKDFATLKKILGDNVSQQSSLSLRLLIAGLAVGVDNLQSYEGKKATPFDESATGLASSKEYQTKDFSELAETFEQLPSEFLVWMNEQVQLDDELIPGALRMRFADVPTFVEGVYRVNADVAIRKSDHGLKIINAAGRALQCFEKWEDKQSAFEHLLVHALKFDFNSSLFNSYPWLIEQLDPELKDPMQEARALALKEKGGNSEDALKQLRIFEKQLQSINFASTNYLPGTRELSDLMADIAKSINPAQTRREVVSSLLKKQCAITFQDAPFRSLEQKEIEKAITFMDEHLKPGFKLQNLELCRTLFRQYVAVKAEAGSEQQIERFLTVLARLDNKAHFDELGQVLGALLFKAKQNGQKRYSIPQLTSWLQVLMDEKVYDLHHYPINLLKVLLDNELAKDSSLLNDDLNKLKEKDAVASQILIKGLVEETLPNQYKPVLAKLILEDVNNSDFVKEAQAILGCLHEAKGGSEWMNALVGLIEKVPGRNLTQRRDMVRGLAQEAKDAFEISNPSENMLSLWQRTQIKLINLLVDKTIQPDDFERHFPCANPTQAYIKVILTQALGDWQKERHMLADVRERLKTLPVQQLRILADYYSSEPLPTLTQLNELLAKPELKDANSLIHHFETVEQGLNDKGEPKRHYSITEDDRRGLMRVLAGFKRKGARYLEDVEQKELINLLYYTNNYSQAARLHELPLNTLTRTLDYALDELKAASNDMDKHQASARVLACMREVLLRKSGKWANHTQMLALLYAALYNDESLLHQVRTGQGKSIITVMRSSYLALNDYVVDVFSSKDSLSKRDHEEFAPVLDAMGIQHAYITENSPARNYKTRSRPGVGAINYATIGNFSLFHSGHIWGGKDAIELDPKRRAAWLDEADYILRFEQTQFNYSDNTDSDPIYNMDEWVYRVTYDWYLENRHTFKQIESTGVLAVSRQEHLQSLCKYLQERLSYSPKQSHFFERHIIPALSGNEEALKKRDQQLKQLLTAAHVASNLTVDTDFCIRPDNKAVVGGLNIDTRAAKVVIGNQVRLGSTYSDLVQQFLHVRLNKEAIAKGQTSDFFVDPNTQIALSQNVPYLLRKYYSKLEGCTGTAGNNAALRFYREEFGIEHISKLPTHEEIRTTYLPMIFCDSEEEQVKTIAAHMIEHQDQPLLHACKDDPAVKRLSRKIGKELEVRGYPLDQFLVDTNDSGKQESEVLPLAGRIGAVSNSSRLGRGTDIKPQSPKGLGVIRSYPADPDVEKQERGRQGRNGAQGFCVDVINFRAIQKEFATYMKSAHAPRLNAIYEEQALHLSHKLQKHKHNLSQKWAWLENDEATQRKYIVTRSVVQLNHELKKEREQFLRRKEYLIATLSGEVMDVLHKAIKVGDQRTHMRLRTAWLEHRKLIEDAWNGRLTGKAGDSEEVYTEFFKKADAIWHKLCVLSPQLDKFCLVTLATNTADLNEGYKGVMVYLKEQTQIWKDKLVRKQLKADDLSALTSLKKKLKVLALEWHPDKLASSNKTPEEKDEIGPEIFKQISELMEIREDCEHALSGKTEETVLSNEEAIHSNTDVHAKHEVSEMALVKYVPVYRHVPSNQKRDMAAVVEFYQEWIKRAEDLYFRPDMEPQRRNELLAKVYGGNEIFLGLLYKELKSASSHQEKGKFPVEVQDRRRQQLFSFLTDCVKQYPAVFNVSCAALAEVLQTYNKHGDEAQDVAFFAGLKAFFAQNWLNSKLPSQLDGETIRKNSLLLSLTMKINHTAFVSEHDASKTFIKNFNEIIHREFWDAFPRLPELEALFTSNSNVTRLLVSHTNKNDLGYLIHLINENHKNEYMYSEKEVEQANIRISRLVSYLEKHADVLMEFPGQLRPLFAIILADNGFDPQHDYLPEPGILRNLPAELRNSFWHFLSERLPLNQEACDALIENLSSQEMNKTFVKQVLKPLFALPPYVPLAYINNALRFKPGRYQFDDCQKTLEQIQEAALVFNRYLVEKGIIKSADAFVTPAQPEKLITWTELFCSMSPEKAKEFFLAVKGSNLADEHVISLLKQYSKGVINLTQLTTVLETVQMIERIKPQKDKYEFLFEKYKGYAASDNFKEIENLKTFATILVKKAAGDLSKAAIKVLWNSWVQGNDQAKVKESLKLINAFRDFDIRYPTINLLDDYLKTPQATRKHEFYRDFLEVMNSEKHQGLPAKTVDALYQAYFKTQIIRNKQHLSEALTVIHEADARLVKKKEWSVIFGRVTGPGQPVRQKIMQLLHHNILNLGEGFAKKCYDHYQSLATKIVSRIPEDLGNNREGRALLQKCYKELSHFARELVEVAKAPFVEQVKDAHEVNAVDIQAKHKAYFEKQQKKYAGFWWTNALRKEQSDVLFDSLDRKPFYETKENYYIRTLNTIWETQKDILLRDRDTQYNKKGYSRLYDITVQMFLQVAKDLLEDRDVSLQLKSRLNGILQEQTSYHLTTLYERLPEKSVLKRQMEPIWEAAQQQEDPWSPGSVELSEIANVLKTNKTYVPKQLKYLVDNLECLIQLPDSASLRLDSSNGLGSNVV
ncbi:hypothetical protein [Legionella jamestowniensis]|uniref:Coiled-coil protein n=1 Tax=Legionella jamestowniensis TaxID=455 RepID=A0A0W0UZF0_9GAMM|nr:hypothetical protein [Legionella jamestowniensis]KTD13224.1 coiled-coil protein [Legionella jamestowniensis]SFL78470.1 SecA DEAD-like domain-containing protein [Legionella jamestowniensis DSM 19215]